MAAVWMRVRGELLRRRRAFVWLIALIAVLGGCALTAAAGARRTLSAYPRFIERFTDTDATVSTGRRPETDQIFETIARMPSVAEATRVGLFIGSAKTSRGKEVEFPDLFLVAPTAPHPRSWLDFKILDGRPPANDRPDELMANYAMADRLDVQPGDRIFLTVDSFPGTAPMVRRSGSYLVTGVYATAGEFETLTESGFPSTLTLSPAFAAQNQDLHVGDEDNLALRLRGGEKGFAAFERDLRATTIQVDGKAKSLMSLLDGDPDRTSDSTTTVQSLTRMPALTLALLAGFLAVSVAAMSAQSLGRESHLRITDVGTLRALGMRGRTRAALEIILAAIIASAGAAGAVLVAVALSPFTPVGLARIAEPDPGFSVDVAAMAVGGFALVVMILLAASPAAVRAARRPSTEQVGRRTPIAERLARVGAPATAVTGVGLGLDPGRGRSSVPVRSTIIGVALAVATLVAAFAFRASMDRLRADPELSGFSYDAVVSAFEGPDSFLPELRAVDEVADTWRGAFFSGAKVDRFTPVTATSFEGVRLSLVSGRAPRSADEVALDGRTLRLLKLTIGDSVVVGSSADVEEEVPPRPFRVVGEYVPPRSPFLGDYPGQGAALTKDGVESIGGGWDAVYLRFAPGVELERGLTLLRDRLRGKIFAVTSRAQSVSARNISSIARLPVLLATALGVLGAATLIHTMFVSVRRRRKDLAILKTLGFVGRQIRATVAWQATSIIILGLAVGVPAGVVLGRWGWRLFAGYIEVVPLPIVPALLFPIAIAVALATGNLIAAFPARSAARTGPALVLRTE